MDDAFRWRGRRGEWYVVFQFCLFGLVAFGPRTLYGWPGWPFPESAGAAAVGWAMLTVGGLLAVGGATALGSKICAVPCPPADAVLHTGRAFRIVRHPMYGGALLAAFGWALVRHSWLIVGYTVLLFVLFEFKTRREEKWLVEKFTGWVAYQRRVRKLIPFIY